MVKLKGCRVLFVSTNDTRSAKARCRAFRCAVFTASRERSTPSPQASGSSLKRGKYKKFKGNVASVYSHPHCHGGSANGHYNGNAKTYMDVGLAMGAAMVELLGGR